MEHRWGERLLVNFPVHISAHAFSQRDGRLTDLSVSGAHLAAELAVRALARIEIMVLLPQRSKHHATAIPAYIARKYRDGFGIEWCQFAPAPVSELLRAALQHPYAYLRHPVPLSSLTRSRLSGPLLRHAE
jgi:hypothetical protein